MFFKTKKIDYQGASDNELLALIKHQDKLAFGELVARHTTRFYRIAYRVMGNQEESEDVVQDCFVKLWQKPDMWKEDSKAKFTTWFYRVITNRAIDVIRTRKYMADSDDTVLALASSDNVEDNIISEQVKDMVAKLPEKQAMAINLCFYEGVKNKEAAEIMGVGVKALESLLMRAKATLKQQVSEG